MQKLSRPYKKRRVSNVFVSYSLSLRVIKFKCKSILALFQISYTTYYAKDQFKSFIKLLKFSMSNSNPVYDVFTAVLTFQDNFIYMYSTVDISRLEINSSK